MYICTCGYVMLSGYALHTHKLYHNEDEEEGEIETILSVVPSVYHDFLEVFSQAKASKLPERCLCNHSIELVGPLPPVEPIYSLSNKESEVL